jgi:hypothetical protein
VPRSRAEGERGRIGETGGPRHGEPERQIAENGRQKAAGKTCGLRLPVPWQTGTADRDCGFDQGTEPSHLRLRRRVVVSPDLRTCQCTSIHKEAVLLSQSQDFQCNALHTKDTMVSLCLEEEVHDTD